jgi:hypothetical protein
VKSNCNLGLPHGPPFIFVKAAVAANLVAQGEIGFDQSAIVALALSALIRYPSGPRS